MLKMKVSMRTILYVVLILQLLITCECEGAPRYSSTISSTTTTTRSSSGIKSSSDNGLIGLFFDFLFSFLMEIFFDMLFQFIAN